MSFYEINENAAMEDNFKPISEFIKSKRKELNYSQIELAKLSNVSERSIQLIEADKKVKPSTLNSVLEVFGKELVVTYSYKDLKNI